MEKIHDGENLLAIVWRDTDWVPGLNFVTPDEWFVQVGCWEYSDGKELGNHHHKIHERTINKTQEMAFVKRGRMNVRIYDEAKALVEEVILEAGDFIVLAHGGHGYNILEEGTQVLEAKNGPFVSVDADKELF